MEEEKETLHFVAITEKEKKLLNIYRNFRSEYDLDCLIEEQTEEVVRDMVDHSIEEMALEESINISRKKKLPPYQVFMKIKMDIWDESNSDASEYVNSLIEQWTEQIDSTLSGDLVELPNE